MKEKMKELNRLLEKAIYKWPPDRIDPQQGGPNEEGYCCLGARLDMLLPSKLDLDVPSYLRGVDKWIKIAGGNRLHAILMLREAGAPHDPFGVEDWEIKPGKVLENFKEVTRKIEEEGELPDLIHQNFKRCDLEGIVLQGLHLGHSSFYAARLDNCTILNCSLIYCDLRYTRLSRLDGRKVTVSSSNFRYALKTPWW